MTIFIVIYIVSVIVTAILVPIGYLYLDPQDKGTPTDIIEYIIVALVPGINTIVATIAITIVLIHLLGRPSQP